MFALLPVWERGRSGFPRGCLRRRAPEASCTTSRTSSSTARSQTACAFAHGRRRSRFSAAPLAPPSSSGRRLGPRTAELLNEQYITEFFRGVEAPESVGERAPDHRLEAEEEPVAEITYPVAEDQTVRYADASGDHFAIHLDDDFARSSGSRVGSCTGSARWRSTGRAVLEAAEVADPARIERLAVRFSAPLFPGDTLTTRIWDLGSGSYGFEAVSGQGATVVKDGRAVIRARADAEAARQAAGGYVRSGFWSAPGAPEKISVITPSSSFVERYANVSPLYPPPRRTSRPRPPSSASASS